MRFSPALLAVLLAACGTSDPKPAAEPSSVATAAAAAAPPPASEPTPSAEELKQALAEAELTMPTPSPDEPEYIFGCTTRAHRARVSVKDGVATYEGRKASQAWETEPELTLVGATERTASEDCDARSWTFANEGHTYEVRDGGCDRADSPPPGPWTGKLVIKKGDKVVASDDCGPSGGIARQGWTMRWRPGYMEAQKDGEAPVVIYSDRAERGPGGTVSEEQQTLLSVVGPYISYATQYHATGGAHPSYGVTWTVVDVSMPGRPLDLRELFGAEAVFEQLKRDPAIVAANTEPAAADLDGLLEALDGGCTAAFGPDMLRSFAFHHVTNNDVAVAVGVTHGCEAERGTFTILPLTFTAVDPLSTELQFANQAGALMQMLAP